MFSRHAKRRLRVLVCLIQSGDELTVSELVIRTGIVSSQVIDALAWLLARDCVDVERLPNGSTVYSVHSN